MNDDRYGSGEQRSQDVLLLLTRKRVFRIWQKARRRSEVLLIGLERAKNIMTPNRGISFELGCCLTRDQFFQLDRRFAVRACQVLAEVLRQPMPLLPEVPFA